MARKKRQRISYVIPLANSPGGHRLGVNGLAFDHDRSILYSGGRDGVICAWTVDAEPPQSRDPNTPCTTFHKQVQAHTHWVNDVVLAQNNSALVSASSDVTVKAWRPDAQDGSAATTIGAHSDYVKCLASPSPSCHWVASGGLDHKICLWDMNGAGQSLEINVGKVEEGVSKGSVYALCTKGSILASGGPESVVRLWDPKSGKSITKLVGHADNIRSILMSDDGGTLMTASSDQTVKIWSVTAGRCMHTLTMHNDSVWSLFSDHPELSVFYSSDRSGMIAKTDTRRAADWDEGLSVAVCQEHEGVAKVIAANRDIWTATSSSSINRWKDVDTELQVETPHSPQHSRAGSSLSESESRSPAPADWDTASISNSNIPEHKIPINAVLRLAITAPVPGMRSKNRESSALYAGSVLRKASEAIMDNDLRPVLMLRDNPIETVQGQNGLIKHVLLNDRKRVLTSDTAGEVILWDLLKCVPIRSYGKRGLDDALPEVNTVESIANWCTVDTRTGKLTVALEENNCFDGEVYADEIDIPEKVDFREDQRINLGKWVLRNLFTSFVDEEIRRDEIYRRNLQNNTTSGGMQRRNAPPSISLPSSPSGLSNKSTDTPSMATPRPLYGVVPMTPGLSIGVATPGVPANNLTSHVAGHLTPTAEEEAGTERRQNGASQQNNSGDRSSDYFSSIPDSHQSEASSEHNKALGTPGEGPAGTTPAFPTDDKEEKKRGSLFGKNFKMTFPKNMKLGRTSIEVKPAAASEEKPEDVSDKSSEPGEKVFEDNLLGVIEKIRHEYEEQARARPDQPLSVGITPSLPNETPVLRPPPDTLIIIQEDDPDSGGVADLYRENIGALGRDADVVEKVAPMWLGELLLRNSIPLKDTVKVSFILQPYQNLLPSIASPDGNARLNANRMLRAKKILSYVAERIEPAPDKPDPTALKPEEYLDLYCHDQIVHPNTTLATIRVHIWRTGGDVVLFYKANGRKAIRHANNIKPTPAATGAEALSATPVAVGSQQVSAQETLLTAFLVGRSL